MPNYDNPADRLYTILSAFADAQESDQSVNAVWADTLNVPTQAVGIELCRIAGLVHQTVSAVHLAGDVRQVDNVDYWAPHLAAFLTSTASSGQNASGVIQPDLLRALGLTASYLQLVAPEGTVPADDQIGGLRDQVSALLDEAREAGRLPLALRTVLVRRLHDVLYALDHVRLVGPDGVQAAIERLVCSLNFTDPDAADDVDPDGILTRVRNTARAVYIAFLSGPATQQALEGWVAIGQRVIGS